MLPAISWLQMQWGSGTDRSSGMIPARHNSSDDATSKARRVFRPTNRAQDNDPLATVSFVPLLPTESAARERLRNRVSSDLCERYLKRPAKS
jgi:hypothetical protein